MTVTTVPVTVKLADFGGPALQGVKIIATLSGIDYTVDGVFVGSEPVTGTTDATGTAVLDVFPNQMAPDGLGTLGTTVRFTASIPGSRSLNVNAVVPNVPCDLTDILIEEDDPSFSEAQLYHQRANAAALAAEQRMPFSGPTPPDTSIPNRLWFNTNNGKTYQRYDDGDSTQWVEAAGFYYTDVSKRSFSLNASFDEVVAMFGSPDRTYAFGSAAQAADGVTPVRNLTDLATYFNAFEDFTGKTTINGEIQRYKDFNATNHAFATDRVNLQAVLEGAGWSVRVTEAGSSPAIHVDGTANPIAVLGLPDTTGLRVGQMVAAQFKGLYVISAIVPDTTVSLMPQAGSPTGTFNSNLLAWLPVDSAPIAAQVAAGATIITFASVPAAVQANPTAYQVAYVSGTNGIVRDDDYRLVAADATSVTLDKPTTWGTLNTPLRIVFVPSVTSGQLWSKELFDTTCPDTFFALEFDVDLCAGSRFTEIGAATVTTAATFNALPNDVPWGAFIACWFYGGNNGAGFTSTTAECDVMELYMSSTNGPRWMLSNNLGPGVGKNLLMRIDGINWTSFSGHHQMIAPNFVTGRHKFQFVMFGGRTYRWVDGVMVQADVFDWASQRPVQIGMDVAVGSLAQGFAANLMFPMHANNFPSIRMGVCGLKVWHRLF